MNECDRRAHAPATDLEVRSMLRLVVGESLRPGAPERAGALNRAHHELARN